DETNGQATSATTNAAWKAQSIVDGTPNGVFSYPQTAVSGWVCSNGENPSSAQAEYYFQNILGQSQTAGYSLNRVDHCSGAEDTWNGVLQDGTSAYTASLNDITDPVQGCVKRH